MPPSKVNKKIDAFIDNRCYECDKSYASAPGLITHMERMHKIQLPSRRAGIKRRNVSTKYNFVTKGVSFQRTLLGCPSCWFYCPEDLKRLCRHINETHLDESMTEGYESPEEEEGAITDDDEVVVVSGNKKKGRANTDEDRYKAAENDFLSKLQDITATFSNMIYGTSKKK